MPDDTTDSPRIVVLGMAGVGKTALVASLARAAQAQLKSSDGGTIEAPVGLTASSPRDADLDEVDVVYLQSGTPVRATLIDCAGRVAQEYIAGTKSLDDRSPLATVINRADALVLAVAPADQSQVAPAQLAQFLALLEQRRGKRSEVAGLPVYLVLTKCDLLLRADDTANTWSTRIEEVKFALAGLLQQSLEPLAVPFGKIDLVPWATAVKPPALGDGPARLREPYGVAGLLESALVSAHAFHEERARSLHRVHVAVTALLGLIVFMSLGAAGLLLSLPSAEVAAMENSIRSVLPGPAVAVNQWLREPLVPKINELVKIQEDPAFVELPRSLRKEVQEALEEMTSYQEFNKKLSGLKLVRFFKKEEDIESYGQELEKIALPSVYAVPWAGTQLGKKFQQYQNQLASLTTALAEEKGWLKKQIEEGDQLVRMAIPAEGSAERVEWIGKADAFLKRKDLAKVVPGIPNMKLRDLYEFPTVNSLRSEYKTIRTRVDRIRGGLEPAAR